MNIQVSIEKAYRVGNSLGIVYRIEDAKRVDGIGRAIVLARCSTIIGQWDNYRARSLSTRGKERRAAEASIANSVAAQWSPVANRVVAAPSSRNWRSDSATEAQVNYIMKLADRAWNMPWEATEASSLLCAPTREAARNLTKGSASNVIDLLRMEFA